MAKEAYYFSHDANSRNDPKILSMMLDYGIEGYGMFWIIVENLREQDGYKLKQDKSTWRAFAMQMHKTVEEVKIFINDCVLEYELFVIDDVYFYSESLLRRMYKKDKIIQKRKDAANTRWSKDKNTNVMQVHSKSNANVMQLDAKETKLNETKLNEIKKNKECTVGFNEIRKHFPGTKTLSDAKKKLPKLIKEYSVEELIRTCERYKKFVIEKRKTEHPNLNFVIESTFWNGRYMDFLDENTEKVKPKVELKIVREGF